MNMKINMTVSEIEALYLAAACSAGDLVEDDDADPGRLDIDFTDFPETEETGDAEQEHLLAAAKRAAGWRR
jgi:hypothetical protein